LIFSIALGADYSFYVKFIATFTLTFFGYIISVLASVVDEGLIGLIKGCRLVAKKWSKKKSSLCTFIVHVLHRYVPRAFYQLNINSTSNMAFK
jgi:hypothetical protein